jgi:hypothetical protein
LLSEKRWDNYLDVRIYRDPRKGRGPGGVGTWYEDREFGPEQEGKGKEDTEFRGRRKEELWRGGGEGGGGGEEKGRWEERGGGRKGEGGGGEGRGTGRGGGGGGGGTEGGRK